jgi:hypothetical protein
MMSLLPAARPAAVAIITGGLQSAAAGIGRGVLATAGNVLRHRYGMIIVLVLLLAVIGYGILSDGETSFMGKVPLDIAVVLLGLCVVYSAVAICVKK